MHREIHSQGYPVSYIHGFTQTGKTWLPLIREIPTPHQATLFDAPGHGDNPTATLSLEDCGDEIAKDMTPGILIGYSMGARMALHTAIQHPKSVSHLVLISGTAGIRDDSERLARKMSDDNLADHIELVGVPAFIDEWLGLPMFAGLNNGNNNKSERLRNTSSGLADSLRFAGTGTQKPLWDTLSSYDSPVTLISGSLDAKFTSIAIEMAQLLPRAVHHLVPDSGHTVHIENQSACANIIDDIIRHCSATAKPTA